jgi:hypothetical protein
VARKATEASADTAPQLEAASEVVDEVVADPEPPATPSRRTRKVAALETGEDAQPDEG